MRILVAGGAGFIGSALVPELLDHGYEVDVIDLMWFGNNLPKGINTIKKDLFTCSAKELEGYDQVVFLAGLSNDPMAEYSPSKNFIMNGALPSYIAYLSKMVGVKRFVYASSCSVYGYTVDKLYDEESPAISSYPYGISKLQGEYGVMQLNDNEFSVISLRQGTVCGYSPRMRFDLVVNTMFRDAIHDRKIKVNNPSIWRPILSIKDAVNAYLRSIQANYSISGIFNIASGNYTVGTIGDIVKDRMEQLTDKKIRLNIDSVEDYRNYKVKFDKAKTLLGYIPKDNIEEIVNSLHDHLGEYKDFFDEKFYNIKVFKKLCD